jgi:hypothetical protein
MQKSAGFGNQMLSLGKAEVGVGSKFGSEFLEFCLFSGGQSSRGLAEAEAEKFAKAVLAAHQVIESSIGFDRERFLQSQPVHLDNP